MTIKNMLGGALINYGDTLPAVGTTPDGALFLKTGGGGEGLYIYRLVADTSPATIGNQAGAGWNSIVSTGGSGLNADTLDGFDSTYFQPADPDLAALAALSTTGLVVRTGAGALATRSLVAGTGISLVNDSGVGGNITVAVNEPGITLNNLGGTLAVNKGGTGSTATPAAGSVIVGTGSTFGSTGAGVAGQLLQSAGAGTPTWVSPASLTVGNATNAASALQSNNSLQLNGFSADTAANPNTVALRDGAADINARLFRSSFANESFISGGIVFRVNDSTNNFLRTCSDVGAIRGFLDVPSRAGADASGTWNISITGNAASATSATSAATLTTGRTFNITGPSATPSLLATEGGVSFNGSGDVTLRVGGIDAALLTAGVVPNGRLSGAYTLFTSIQGSGVSTFDQHNTNLIVFTSSTAAIRRNTTDGFLEVNGGAGTGQGAGMVVFGTTGATNNVGRLRIGTSTIAEWTTGGLTVNGAITATGNVTAFAPSDARLKQDVEVIGAAVSTVKKLRGVSYTMKGTGRREVGLIAQELLQVVPEVVREGSDGFYGVQYGHLVGLLVEAIKEQQVQIDDLKEEVAALRRQ